MRSVKIRSSWTLNLVAPTKQLNAILSLLQAPRRDRAPSAKSSAIAEASKTIALSRIHAQVESSDRLMSKLLMELNRLRSGAIESQSPLKQVRNEYAIEVAILKFVLDRDWTLNRRGPLRPWEVLWLFWWQSQVTDVTSMRRPWSLIHQWDASVSLSRCRTTLRWNFQLCWTDDPKPLEDTDNDWMHLPLSLNHKRSWNCCWADAAKSFEALGFLTKPSFLRVENSDSLRMM